jgi:signal transduction histidine kinase
MRSDSFQNEVVEAPVQQQLVEQAYQAVPVQNLKAFAESSGWFVWYWDRGLNLIYWQRRPSGHIVGCALERARWMADLVAQLPETVASDSGSERSIETRVRLVNSAAASVYQWGSFEPPKDAKPLCEVPLAVPLASWRLQCFVPMAKLTAGTGRSVYLSLFASLAAVAVALGVIAWFFVREYARDMKEASQQVSFVNQVSHELKTPLTNIRMYAELLERDLENVSSADAEKPKQRLEIIRSEGQRLTRLIGNVLTFARQKKKTLQLQPREVIPDELIGRIVDRFRPAFADQQIEVALECNASNAMHIDPDFLEQILGNLLSNVEKYAASGGLLNVHTNIKDDLLTVDVCDAGPGIPSTKRTQVFEPFARITNDVSYAAGTGIGLSIARELARLHGGDIELQDAETGCWFRATLKNQSV